MRSDSIISADPYRIELSDDNLSATLFIEAGCNVSADEILGEIRALSLANVCEATLRQSLANRGQDAISLEICRGIAAVDEKPPRFEFQQAVADDAQGIVARIEQHNVAGRVLQAIPGTPGRDIFGKGIRFKPSPADLDLGNNLAIQDDKVIATVTGNLRCKEGRYFVEPLLEFKPHGGAPTPVDFAGDVWAPVGIAEGTHLRSTGSLIVGGAVEPAQLDIGGCVHVHGGIIGKDLGTCTLGQVLWCRFLEHTRIIAGGDVNVQGQIVHSHVQCDGRLTVKDGPICGGTVCAADGVNCKVLGNSVGVPTVVEVGFSGNLRFAVKTALAELETSRARVEAIREKTNPLVQRLKHLTPQQRERVTELLYEAEEIELLIRNKHGELYQKCRAMLDGARAEILVSDTIHAGTAIRFIDVETAIETDLKGPVKLSLRKHGIRNEIVLTAGLHGDSRVLKSVAVDNPIKSFAEHFAGPLAT